MRFSPEILTEVFPKKARIFSKNFTFRHKSKAKKERFAKNMRHPKILLLLFFENGQTTNQEMHNHRVNENHKTKHDLLIVRFSVRDVCS